MDIAPVSNIALTLDFSLLLWIFYVFVLSCVCYVFVRVCLYVLCGHLLGKGWPLGSRLWFLLWVYHFPISILGQVWYLIVSIPDLCTLTYFHRKLTYSYTVLWIYIPSHILCNCVCVCGSGTRGNFGTGVGVSILKPTPVIYLAFEKKQTSWL